MWDYILFVGMFLGGVVTVLNLSKEENVIDKKMDRS